MKRCSVYATMLLLALFPCFLGAEENPVTEQQGLKSIDDCINFCRQAGLLVHEGKPEAAFNLLHHRNVFVRYAIPMSQKTVLLTNFSAFIENIAGEMGFPLTEGFEFITARSVGQSVMHVYFWSKYQYGPVPWKFTFYKPKDEWKFADINLGADLLAEVSLLSTPINVKKD